jgi:hypothetical protein
MGEWYEVKEMDWDDVDWINLAEKGNQLHTLVKVMNVWIPYKHWVSLH